MKFKLKFMGKVKLGEYASENYKIDGVSVCFSITRGFVAENNVDTHGFNVAAISFSNGNKPVPEAIVEYCLNRFGFDKDRMYYVNKKPVRNFQLKEPLEIIYYEQLTERELTK